MAAKHTLSTDIFATWNQALMQTNPPVAELTGKVNLNFGNDINLDGPNEPTQGM